MRREVVFPILIAATLFWSGSALAGAQLQYVWSCAGNTAGCGGTVVFIHGKADCSTGMSDCNGSDATTGPAAYWTNRSTNANLMNEATTKYVSAGTIYYEAFAVGYDLDNQGFWYSANDVGYCLQDLYQGTNNSGCNPNHYQRTNFYVVTHSAGATVIDRLLSTGWWGINSSHVNSSYVGTIAPALAGSRASSALYGTDGYGGWCTSLASWLAGWAFKNNGAASLTRGSVIGEANKGYAGRSPQWLLKITSTGGGGSANNNNNTGVNESDNDSSMGALACCLGYPNSWWNPCTNSGNDDMDGLLYWSDTDPTNNTSGNGCGSDGTCKYYSQFTGAYWHWAETWANHSHSRDDAYTTVGDWQSSTQCYWRSPGTCVGQYLFN
jgi:hypothetical protein